MPNGDACGMGRAPPASARAAGVALSMSLAAMPRTSPPAPPPMRGARRSIMPSTRAAGLGVTFMVPGGIMGGEPAAASYISLIMPFGMAGAGRGGGGGDDKGEGKAAAVDRAKSIMKAGLAGGLVVGGGLLALSKEANVTREKANRLSINSRGAGQDYVDPAQLTKEFYAISQSVKGVTADQAAEAATAFVAMTGDLATARSSLKDFAVVASATGASVEDVAKTSAAISQQFGITDPAQIKDVLASLTYQGKSGAFELADAASLFPRLAAAGAAFGLDKGAGGVKTLGGITQIARTATGSGEQAATSVESMLTKLKTESGTIAAQGVKVYEGTGANKKMRDLPGLLVDLVSKVGGNDVEAKNAGLAKILGEQGVRAVNPLISKFNDTFRNTKGTTAEKTKAAEAAVRTQLDSAANAAGSWADVQNDSARAQEDSSAKVTAAMERLKESAANKLLPALLKLEPTIMKGVDAFAKIVDFGAQHPGVAITAAIVGSMGAAAIGEAVKAKLLAMMMGGGGGGGGVGAVAGGGAMAGAAAVAVTAAAGYVAYTEGKDLNKQWDENSSTQLGERFSQVGLFGEERNPEGASKMGQMRWETIAAEVRHAVVNAPPAAPGTPKGSPLPSKMQIDNTVNVKVTNAADMKGNTAPLPGHLPR